MPLSEKDEDMLQLSIEIDKLRRLKKAVQEFYVLYDGKCSNPEKIKDIWQRIKHLADCNQ